MLHILTLTWQNKDKLERLKKSLFQTIKNVEFTWWIKDNFSNDGTVEMCQSWGDNVKVIAYPNNQQNFSQGCNHLFELANPKNSDYVMLLNNDVTFTGDNSILNMLKIMDDPEVGVVGARLLYTNTNKLQHAGVVFDEKYKFPTHFRAGQEADQLSMRNREFQVVTGAVLLTKAEYYRAVGLMDNEFDWSFDDVCFCLAVKYKLNKKIVYCGQTTIYHDESASLKKNPVNKLFLNKNLNLLVSKWSKYYKIDSGIYNYQPKHNLYK